MTNYKEIARQARINVLKLVHTAQVSHLSSNWSCAELLAVLFEKMNLETDVFIASKGWVAASIYFHLVRKGILSKEVLDRYCQEGEEEWIGLCEPRKVFGLVFAGGSMQMGTGASSGFALAKKIKKESGRVYVLESDGAMQGGIIWETAAIAAHHKLDNLVLLIDFNQVQATGMTNEILEIDSLRDKFQAFHWSVKEIDGHNCEEIEKALSIRQGSPLAIIAHTRKGKGVGFIEKEGLRFHYAPPTEKEYKLALKELCRQ